jgi:hypothetical protein
MATELEKIKLQIRLAAFIHKQGTLRNAADAICLADHIMDLALAKLAEQQVEAGEEGANGMRIIDEESEKGYNLTLDQALELLKELGCDESHK